MRFLYSVVDVSFTVYNFLIMARVLLSWLPIGFNNGAVRFIYEMTEPFMGPIRRLMGGGLRGLDFSPILAIFILEFAHRLALNLIFRLIV